MRSSRMHLLGAPLDPVTLEDAVRLVDEAVATRRPALNASLNAAKLVRIQTDSELRESIELCDLVTADGVPVVWAARALGHALPGRVNGTDLMELLFAHAAVYLLGSEPGVLSRARAELERRHPAIRIAGTQHGFFAASEEPAVVERIAAARPDVLFIALGTPQKELFQARHRDALGIPFTMGVGGSFEVLAGMRKRAPRWAQRSGLEWAFRLVQEPRRLAGRYVVGNTRFVFLVGREVLRTRLGTRS
jgi:N-acetylglucosaminyldiphosphoundecaprenol N-acetyl-beta-D-mannosaminyltransferase